MSDTLAVINPREAKTVGSDRGTHWISEGWRMFTAAPGVWIAVAVVMIVIQLLLNIVPVIGGLAASILAPVFLGGIMAGCAAADRGEPFQFECLFLGFRSNTGTLVTIGVLYLIGVVVISMVGVAVLIVGGGGAILAALWHSGGVATPDMLPGDILLSSLGIVLLATCIVLILFIPLLMTLWFAPALAMLDHLSAGAAMKSSLTASLRNWLPFTIYSLVLLVLMVVAAIPLMLGYLILVPVVLGSVYASYRDIYC